MTDSLKRARAVCKAATKGPWKISFDAERREDAAFISLAGSTFSHFLAVAEAAKEIRKEIEHDSYDPCRSTCQRCLLEQALAALDKAIEGALG